MAAASLAELAGVDALRISINEELLPVRESASRSSISRAVMVKGGETINQWPYLPPDVGRE